MVVIAVLAAGIFFFLFFVRFKACQFGCVFIKEINHDLKKKKEKKKKDLFKHTLFFNLSFFLFVLS